MSDTNTIEDRLRRAFDAVAETTTVSNALPPTWPADVDHPRARHTRPFALVAAVVTVLAVAAVVFAVRSSAKRTDVHTDEPTTTGRASFPSAVKGTEQRIREVKPPPNLPGGSNAVRDWTYVAGTTPKSYSVEGGTPFAVVDIAKSVLGVPRPLPARCTMWEGTLPIGGQGYGGELECDSLADLTAGLRHGLASLPAFPTPKLETIVWTGVPERARYVTLTVAGERDRSNDLQLWERPVGRVAAFVRTEIYENYPQYTEHPNPVLRAYDRDGTLLQEVKAPAYNGDPRAG
jgi:hypothetical protein